MQAILPDIEQMEIDLPEIQDIDAHEIIRAKLQEALKHHSGPFIVEDTSLSMEALNGLPGPLIKWFLKAMGVEGLSGLAAKMGNSRATAKAMLGYAQDPENIEFFEGTVEGQIVVPRGDTKFGWDPIFQPDGFEKTFAEMTSEEKNAISHRKQAALKLKEYLNQ